MQRSLIALTLFTAALQATESTLQFRHRESSGVGYSKGYTSLDYLLTAQGGDAEFLLDLRGHIFNDGRLAGNTGVGFRYSLYEDDFRIGANAFYDFRSTKHFFANQIGGGLEFLSRSADVRINGYLPTGKNKEFEEKKFQNFAGNYAFVYRKLHAALPCIDGEIGVPFCSRWYAAAGAYYLFSKHDHHVATDNTWGGKARIDVTIGRYVGLELAATYDSIFDFRAQGVFTLNIPLGKRGHKPRNLRRVPIMRNEIIPIEVKRKSHDILTSGETPIRFLFVSNAATAGDGSFEKPFSSLKEAESHSEPGDVIYVFPGDGTPRHMDEGIVLKGEQVLASSGATLTLPDIEIPAMTPGEKPVITNVQPDKPVVSNPGKSRLDDFLFLPPWEYLLQGLNALQDFPLD
jgi:hypothetical protein